MGLPVATRNTFLDTLLSSTLYLALFTIAPDNEGEGGEEVSAVDYVRIPFASWEDAALGSKTNSIIARWSMTTSDWGRIVRAGLYDSLVEGNFVARGDNTLDLAIPVGVVPRFAVGELQFTFSNLVD